MWLSKAIELGFQRAKHGSGTYIRTDCEGVTACVLGAAALYHMDTEPQLDFTTSASRIATILIERHPGLVLDNQCPVCGSHTTNLGALVCQNDEHLCEGSDIVNWVKEQEANGAFDLRLQEIPNVSNTPHPNDA